MVNFIDCSLRDGHQSLLATRVNTEQSLRVLPLLAESGYRVLELWGGATIDASIRFCGDDPFERLQAFRKVVGPDIQIRSLCRGQNLFGYTPYPDNVVYEFVKHAVRLGNDRIRIFDALNDVRNLKTALMTTKTFNAHAEIALSYTTSPVHDLDHFVRFATTAIDDGADSIAIKDMAGLLHPCTLFELVDALRARIGKVELSLHSHCTNGLACTTYVAAMMAGVDNLDTCHGPMAGSTAQPPVELMQFFAEELGFETNYNPRHAAKIDEGLRQIRTEMKDLDKDPDKFGNPWPTRPTPEMRDRIRKVVELLKTREKAPADQAIAILEDEILVPQGYPAVDRTQLDAQVPGGMVSNLHNQLKAVGALENMQKILEEIPRVRADAGFVPLVTPTSQIVGSQAAFNVNSGERYSIISEPFRDLVLGKYGRLPGAPNPEVVKLCAPDGKLFSERPAEYAPKVDLSDLVRDGGDLLRTRGDMLLYVLFPQPARDFLTRKYATPVHA